MTAQVPEGCWAEFSAPRQETARPCLFLDRDGVVIVDRHHLSDPAGVELIVPTVEAIAFANRTGWAVGLVTNQSGIGRGLFRWSDFHAVQARLAQLIAAYGARLDFVCACPFHPDAADPYRHLGHPWRKPEPGMIIHATAMLNLDPSRSFIVGDRGSDLEAGAAAGLSGGVLVRGASYRQHLVATLPEDLPSLTPLMEAMRRRDRTDERQASGTI